MEWPKRLFDNEKFELGPKPEPWDKAALMLWRHKRYQIKSAMAKLRKLIETYEDRLEEFQQLLDNNKPFLLKLPPNKRSKISWTKQEANFIFSLDKKNRRLALQKKAEACLTSRSNVYSSLKLFKAKLEIRERDSPVDLSKSQINIKYGDNISIKKCKINQN